MAQGVASAPALQQGYTEQGGPSEPKPPRRREPHRHTYGAIDLGTNNCRLLIARPTDGGFTVIDAFSRIVRLGEGLSQTGELSDEAMDRAVAALGDLRRQAAAPQRLAVALGRDRGLPPRRQRRASSPSACATRPGSSLDIIEPQEEARLAVLGCHKLLEPGDGPALIFDIGGGSTELVLIDQERGQPADPRLVERAVGRRLADRERGQARRSRAPTGSRPTSACASAPAAPSPTSRPCCPKTREGIRLLGTSGTVTTLASVHLALPSYDRRAVDGLHVPIEAMQKISTMIAGMDYEERSACRASAPSAPTWSSPAARSSRRSSRSGRRRTSASPTAASAKASCAR